MLGQGGVGGKGVAAHLVPAAANVLIAGQQHFGLSDLFAQFDDGGRAVLPTLVERRDDQLVAGEEAHHHNGGNGQELLAVFDIYYFFIIYVVKLHLI